MRTKVLGVLAVIGFGILMSVRGELTSTVGRAVIAAIAGGVAAIAWVVLRKAGTPRERGEHV